MINVSFRKQTLKGAFKTLVLYIGGNNKLSLAECRKAVANGEINYTDEELIKIRDWLDNMADIALAIIEKNGIDNMNEIFDRANRNQDEST